MFGCHHGQTSLEKATRRSLPLFASANWQSRLFPQQDGKATIIETGREFTIKATNQLEGMFLASPAVAEGALFLRSDTHLYRIENRNGG